MTRPEAARAALAAADALSDWLRSQKLAARQPPGPPSATPAAPVTPSADGADADAATADRPAPALPTPLDAGGATTRPAPDGSGVRLHLAHTDWLHHLLTITGPAGDLAGFRQAAAGAGTIPWQLDLDRMTEDFFHLLVAPPAPQRRSLSLAGARIVAEQLRHSVARRHALAVARVGQSRACPFDLHALLPVPGAVLALGPDDPVSVAWLWQHWGTTDALRHVAADAAVDPALGSPAARRPRLREGTWQLTFWSADWTPWAALATIASRWPALRFATRPTYDDAA